MCMLNEKRNELGEKKDYVPQTHSFFQLAILKESRIFIQFMLI